MCGLAGFISPKKYSREAQEKFVNILVQAEVRGTDACGIAFVKEKNRFYYAKAPKRASEFVQEKGFKKLIDEYNPNILIGHNRAKTQGDENNNQNNHPIVTKTGLILIHNGVLQNEDEVVKEFNLKPDAEVDSEVIVKLIEYYIYAKKKNTIKAIQLMRKHIRGSMAIALLNDKEPKTLYLMASSNPINLAYHKPTGIIYFASTEDILKEGIVSYDSFFKSLFYQPKGQDDYVFYKMDDDTGLKITASNWDRFDVEEPEIQTSYNNYSNRDNNYGRDYSGYQKSLPIVASQRPVDIESKGEDAIKSAILQYEEFSPEDRIIKPSIYLSDLLLYRLKYLQEMFVNGEYQFHIDGEDKYELNKLHEETRRIIQTLKDRQKITKRKDLLIPDEQDIWLIENDKFKAELKRVGCVEKGLTSVRDILRDNPNTQDYLEVAGIMDLFEDDEIDNDKPPESYREEYYCPSCKSIKNEDKCVECGEEDLRTLDELQEDERIAEKNKYTNYREGVDMDYD